MNELKDYISFIESKEFTFKEEIELIDDSSFYQILMNMYTSFTTEQDLYQFVHKYMRKIPCVLFHNIVFSNKESFRDIDPEQVIFDKYILSDITDIRVLYCLYLHTNTKHYLYLHQISKKFINQVDNLTPALIQTILELFIEAEQPVLLTNFINHYIEYCLNLHLGSTYTHSFLRSYINSFKIRNCLISSCSLKYLNQMSLFEWAYKYILSRLIPISWQEEYQAFISLKLLQEEN